MYDENRKIEDVIKYLYEQKQEKLAKSVLDLIKRCERAEAIPQYPVQSPIPPQIWYGDGVNPPYKITS